MAKKYTAKSVNGKAVCSPSAQRFLRSRQTHLIPPSPVDNKSHRSLIGIELPCKVDRHEYSRASDALEIPHELSTCTSPKQKQRTQDVTVSGLTQRERGEAALDALHTLLRSTCSLKGCALAMECSDEKVVPITLDQGVTMTAVTQQKLLSAIQKVIDLTHLDSISVETQIQLMRLSEGSLGHAEDVEIRLNESWDQIAVDTWIQKLPNVKIDLRAARICLQLVSSSKEGKQPFSEAVIRKCINLFNGMTEDIVMPLVELQSADTGSTLLKRLAKHKKAVSSTLTYYTQLLVALAELVASTRLPETVTHKLEYTALELIFVQNAHNENDSAVSGQKLDGICSHAMDMLCQIFLVKPRQRQGILDGVLSSLGKLRAGKGTSRRFKLSGDSIMPVSALIMRLVQEASGRVEEGNADDGSTTIRPLQNGDDLGKDKKASRGRTVQAVSSISSEEYCSYQYNIAIQALQSVAAPLADASTRYASYVIEFIVKRAMGASEPGEASYRRLLESFVQDLRACLDSPGWPAAELMLRLLVVKMVQIFEAPKTPAPTKNVALQVLGSVSAAISLLRSHVKKVASTAGDPDSLTRYLCGVATCVLEKRGEVDHLVAWIGPYRASLEFLQRRCSDDPLLSSAASFLIADWAAHIRICPESTPDSNIERDHEFGRLAYRLRMMMQDRTWLSNEYSFKAVNENQAKLAYSIILLQSPLCESSGKILNILLRSMASEQATVRSKSSSSLNAILETDPSVLDDNSSVICLVLECLIDPSTQVRDSALSLLGSCISLRPALEPSLTPKIIDRFRDAGVGIRKRAMKLACEIYLRNRNGPIRAAIASSLLRRVQDPDEGVRNLARKIIGEVWFAPFHYSDGTVSCETSLTEHVALIIYTLRTETVPNSLHSVFRALIRPKGKSLEVSFSVCSKLVERVFGFLDNSDTNDPTMPSGRDALKVLTILAKADPNLFNFEQMRLLRPQLASLRTEERAAFRAVTIIYKRVLPALPSVHSKFLTTVRLQLLNSIGKVYSRQAFDDLIACTKVVCDLLKDFGPLANLVASSLVNIQRLALAPVDAKLVGHFTAYSIIVGGVSKHCDLNQHIQVFKSRLPNWKGNSVPKLIVDCLSPFASPRNSAEVRKVSLEAIGLVCQSWPRQYLHDEVCIVFQEAFREKTPVLEAMILRSFKYFLLTEERRSQTSEAASEAGAGQKKAALSVMGGSNFDQVASATTQWFLKDITRISMSSHDEHAFLAAEVLSSINRQGLTHPKEIVVALITLETSPNRKLAELAFIEHQALHNKHETVLERQYMTAVQTAYAYQRDVVKDSHGATMDPFRSKLHLLMEVLKVSKMKNRRRFLEKLCGQMEFDLKKLNATPAFPPHVDFSRFILENLAFFEYQTIGELQTTVKAMEMAVTTTGATVLQAIELEIFSVRIESMSQGGKPVEVTPDEQASDVEVRDSDGPLSQRLSVDLSRLRQLAAASIILLSMWEVRKHLRRLYGICTSRYSTESKVLAEDLKRAPVKIQDVHEDRVWEELQSHQSGLKCQESMLQKCNALFELMHVDKEFKVAEFNNEMMFLDGPERVRKIKGVETSGGPKKRARSSSQPGEQGRPRKQRAKT